MTGINLFEAQALALRALTPAQGNAHRPPEMHQLQETPQPQETPLAAAMRFISRANVSQCGKVAAHLSARLLALEKRHGGMQAANLNEAAQFVADAMLNISAVIDMNGTGDATPCRCGGCDDCVAARSDEHHDRSRDGTMC